MQHHGSVSRAAHARMQKAQVEWMSMGVPEKLAHSVALLTLTRAAVDIVDVAAERKRDVIDSARLYAKFNDELELYWLHESAEDLEVQGRWQAQARSTLREEIYRRRRELALNQSKSRIKRDSFANPNSRTTHQPSRNSTRNTTTNTNRLSSLIKNAGALSLIQFHKSFSA